MKIAWIAILAGLLAFSAQADDSILADGTGSEALSNKHESGVELSLEEQFFGSISIAPLATEVELMRRPPRRGSYYDWGQGRNGWGYCYEYTRDGRALNGGKPVSNYNCERYNPSYYDWGRGRNGWGYCYQYTAYGVAMNEGSPVSNYSCERGNPSYYSWGRGRDGNTYCYQYTGKGVAMNEGRPVSNHYCRW